MAKKRFTTSVDEKVLEDFKVLAIREKKTVSEMLERLMQERLKQYKEEKK